MHEILMPRRRVRPPPRAVAITGVVALLYALGACSNTPGNLKALAKGTMSKLTLTTGSAPQPQTVFKDAAGRSRTLAEFRGKVAIVNIWANWCAPCKEEIPSLARLQAAY